MDRVTEHDYLEKYAEHHYEWVQGQLVKAAPITFIHYQLTFYIRVLIDAYLSLSRIGRIIGNPFVMRLDDSFRHPDLQVILNDNPGEFTRTAMIGAADICVEVVSPSSVSTDYGAKFEEYEKGGVREYWLIDPIRQTCYFHRLTDEALYKAQQQVVDYTTPLLPHFILHVPTLWQEDLPGIMETVEAVKAMFP